MVNFIFLKFIPTVLTFTSMTVTLLIPAAIAAFFPPTKRYLIVSRFWTLHSWFVLKCVCLANITYIDRRKNTSKWPSRPGLYISNHQSLFDIPIYAIPHAVTPLMKKEVAYIPIAGFISVFSGSITVSRKSTSSRRKALKECISRLQQGLPLIYYPEGTRSKTGSPRPVENIHRSLIEKAYNLNVPVIPLSIYGTDKILGNDNRLHPFQNIGMITHSEVWPKDFDNVDDFVNASWGKVLSGHKELGQTLALKESNKFFIKERQPEE